MCRAFPLAHGVTYTRMSDMDDHRYYLFNYTIPAGRYENGQLHPPLDLKQPILFEAKGNPQGYGDALVEQGKWLRFSYVELVRKDEL